jgi:glycosyltransferase involved in cell wall biosynthesis
MAALEHSERDFVTLAVYGDGPDLPAVRLAAERLGLATQVEFRGRIPYEMIGGALADADVFVSPSLSDYRSLTGFEALSSGLPILLSKYDGAYGEVVREGENGFLIDPRDPADITSKFAWCVRNRRRLVEMGRVSAKMAKRFTVDAIVGNLQRSVTECLTGDRSSASGSASAPQ